METFTQSQSLEGITDDALIGSFCSTVAARMPHDRNLMGLNPTSCRACLYSFPYELSIKTKQSSFNQAPKGVTAHDVYG